jgi:hypothetical protein
VSGTSSGNFAILAAIRRASFFLIYYMPWRLAGSVFGRNFLSQHTFEYKMPGILLIAQRLEQ